MLQSWNRPQVRMMAAIMLAATTVAVGEAGGPFGNPFSRETSVQTLAAKIDKLQKHIDEYGTVVTKHPDIWGDGRLAKHRIDVENELKKDLSGFEFRLNAAVTENDSAFLGQALALSSIANGGTLLGGTGATALPSPASVTTTLVSTAASTGTAGADPANLILRTNPTAATFRNSSSPISLEPSLVQDQKNRYLQHLNELRRMNESDDLADSPGYTLNLVRFPVSVLPGRRTSHGYGAEITFTATPYLSDDLLPSTMRDLVVNEIVQRHSVRVTRELVAAAKSASDKGKDKQTSSDETKDVIENRNTSGFIQPFTVPIKPGQPQPTAEVQKQADAVLTSILILAAKSLEIDRRSSNEPLLLDVYSLMKQKVAETYKVLSRPEMIHLWHEFCDEQLASDLALGRNPQIDSRRDEFLNQLRLVRGDGMATASGMNHPELNEATSCFAWLIIVHAASINAALKDDMQQVAVQKNCVCVSGEGLSFVGPDPAPEARSAFNEYVRCRWPVVVFALDPAIDEQNIGLSASRRREMQLVAAIAAANGMISAQKLTRFVRRTELDLAAIDLNRTHIGFSHGNDTFGWRFQPRLQAPEIESNLTVATRDLLIGGPTHEQDLKHRKIEPGIRECTAVVLMPSFVPYVTFDSRADWYRLDNSDKPIYRASSLLPVKPRIMTTADSVGLSRELVELRTLSQACVNDAHLYRDGDVHRLLKAVDNLERSLPLQTAYVQMPFDTGVVPSDMFERGGAGLAPALEGWYGEPGIHVQDSPSVRAAQVRLADIRTRLQQTRLALTDAIIAGKSADVTTLTAAVTALTSAETAAVANLNMVANDGVRATSVFLVGRHFGLFNMQVIAGGVDVTPTMQLISRNLCQVTIPATVGTVEETQNGKKTTVVDVHVANTYGLSTRLSIPVNAPKPVPQVTADDFSKLSKRVDVVETASIPWKLSWASKDSYVILAKPKDGAGNDIEVSAIYTEKSALEPVSLEFLVSEGEVPFPNPDLPDDPELAAWLVDSSNPETRVAVGPIAVTRFGQRYSICLPDFETKIGQGLTRIGKTLKRDDVTSLKIIGYIRSREWKDRPSLRIADSVSLKVKMEPCISK